MIKNPPADAGDTGSIPEDPTCRRATKLTCLNYSSTHTEPVLLSKRSPHTARKSGPHCTQPEGPGAETRPRAAKTQANT